MEQIVLVIHLLITLALIGVILIQRSEGGGLGIGGGSGGGLGQFMSVRGTANLLTRTTAVLAAAFMVTSIVLAILAGTRTGPSVLIEEAPIPAQEQPQAPSPSVPLSD